MKIELLEEFVVFAKHLSFTKAADEMFMSQPSLSIHMSNLEKKIGFRLIERGNQQDLTAAGHVFLERCQALLEIYHEALTEGRMAASATPPVRILDNNRSFKLHRLASMVKDVPYALVNADENLPPWHAIEEDTVDMGIGLEYVQIDALRESAEHRGLDSFQIGTAPFWICVMKTHPLAQKKSLCVQDLYEYPIGIGERSYYDVWSHIVQHLVKPEKPLRFRLDPTGGLSNISTYNFGELVHFFIANTVQVFMQNRDDIAIFKTLDGKPLEMPTVMVYNAKSANPNVSKFVEQLKIITTSPDFLGLPQVL